MTTTTTTTFECSQCGQPCHIDGAFTDPSGRGDVCGDCIEHLRPMIGEVFPTFVTAEKMRIWHPARRISARIVTDYSDPRTDIRGTPIGERALLWEYDRLVAPRPGKRRVREHVKVMHCPEGWYSNSGTMDEADPALCSTLLDPQWKGDGFPGNFNRYQHPVLWVIKVQRHSTVTTYRYCDPELSDEYRPGLQREVPPPVKPRKKAPEASYFATIGHYDRTGQVKLQYWYRVQRGRDEGRIRPWPPGRSHFGRLALRGIPDADTCQEVFGCTPREWEQRFWEDVKDVRWAAMREIEERPEEAAARFAVLQSTCCCGKALTDERSKVYGIGPECRAGLPPEILRRISDQAARKHAEQALRQAS